MKMKINKINKPFVIAEAGSNFNQSLKFGKKLIQRAKKCGASAVKFQLFKAEKLYPDNKKMYKIFKKIEHSEKMFKKFKEFGDKIKIDVFASAFDIESLKFLEKCEIKYHKVASSELTNIKLLKFLSKTNKILFVSTGMSDINDVKQAIKILKKYNKKIVILQCGSLYPLSYEKNNLNVLNNYKKFNLPVGLSDHSLDSIAAVTAIGLGAIVFEKHFTLSKKLPGPDHKFALEPSQLKDYISDINNAYSCMGSHEKMFLPEERKLSRRKSLYFKFSQKKGSILKRNGYVLKSPPLGILPRYKNTVLKKILKKNVKKNTPILANHF